jgi:cell division protein YceG involved in septum cleavage
METYELFFVAKCDGSGEHDFSVTNAEHDRKKMKIRRENERKLRASKKE